MLSPAFTSMPYRVAVQSTTDTRNKRIGVFIICLRFLFLRFLSVYLASLTFGSSIRCTTL